jgi:hypothetical protein
MPKHAAAETTTKPTAEFITVEMAEDIDADVAEMKPTAEPITVDLLEDLDVAEMEAGVNDWSPCEFTICPYGTICYDLPLSCMVMSWCFSFDDIIPIPGTPEYLILISIWSGAFC